MKTRRARGSRLRFNGKAPDNKFQTSQIFLPSNSNRSLKSMPLISKTAVLARSLEELAYNFSNRTVSTAVGLPDSDTSKQHSTPKRQLFQRGGKLCTLTCPSSTSFLSLATEESTRVGHTNSVRVSGWAVEGGSSAHPAKSSRALYRTVIVSLSPKSAPHAGYTCEPHFWPPRCHASAVAGNSWQPR